MPDRSEMLMPVDDDHVLRLREIEALRLVTDNLQRLNKHAEKTNEFLHSVDLRLTRIESNSVNQDVAVLKAKVDDLEKDRDRREGAMSFGNWIIRNWPFLIGMVMLAVVVLSANGKIRVMG